MILFQSEVRTIRQRSSWDVWSVFEELVKNAQDTEASGTGRTDTCYNRVSHAKKRKDTKHLRNRFEFLSTGNKNWHRVQDYFLVKRLKSGDDFQNVCETRVRIWDGL